MAFPTKGSLEGYLSSSNFNVPDLIEESKLDSVKDFLRPVMVSIVQSRRILLDGPTFQNSPSWNIHPLMSEDITIRNPTVRNPGYSQNGDGLDLESYKNVVIYNNTFDVGDDAICFKSGKDKDGRKRNMPTENVVVKNNTVYHGLVLINPQNFSCITGLVIISSFRKTRKIMPLFLLLDLLRYAI